MNKLLMLLDDPSPKAVKTKIQLFIILLPIGDLFLWAIESLTN